MIPYVQDADFLLLNCDVLEGLRSLPDESVHCVVTSPPYWGLRDYGAEGQLGLEATPEEYVARMVDVFREVRRVLRADGTCWLNLGDSYNNRSVGRKSSHQGGLGFESEDLSKSWADLTQEGRTRLSIENGDMKEKDLVGIPWTLAFALRADGWYLRSDIIWSKPNPMPESVTDRPTKAHEYVFLLSKSPRYFFDQEAVREGYVQSDFKTEFRAGSKPYLHQNGPLPNSGRGPDGRRVTHVEGRDGSEQHRSGERWPNPSGRNVRSVWEIATQPYPEAHFATFPEALAERIIKAGTSEHGCCPECGKPWERKTEAERVSPAAPSGNRELRRWDAEPEGRLGGRRIVRHIGWRPGCGCLMQAGHWVLDVERPSPVPCTVLDPFGGSGTTAYVARRLGRRSILIELNEAYCKLAARRMQQQSLFAEAA